ncbi:protein of unknown function [Candidatus Methylacidiphilum fumarolicum]|uniref:Uncharacterized protein n=1 Tax=Candidatus Methylacidiphilum fumarolicum TaxID=591154 RepID=A0ABM9IFV5_9BACT|nr:protein of unknown function [Candidatus Methylacidiphilum fumarolicum]
MNKCSYIKLLPNVPLAQLPLKNLESLGPSFTLSYVSTISINISFSFLALQG